MFQKRSHIVVQVFCLYAVTKTVGVRKEKSTVQSIFGRRHPNKTRICIQTAGSAFGLCSYRIRGNDGSCVEHLTVESYVVIICQQTYLLLLVFRNQFRT